jgi:NAD(P)-dependent dehydrogenase (short-subunit alcohol dehydrogenase family)
VTDRKVWLVTGAGRGLGTHIAKAALDAGHSVVATGRNTEVVKAAVGDVDHLLVVKLDITSTDDIASAVRIATEHFNKIDVLVNNAAGAQMGFFEEITPEQMSRQIETNLIGPMNVTRAVLPEMRRARSGHVITITSLAGLIGQEFVSAYAASKFGLEGWMESLRFEVEPFGIKTTIVEPGFFRTELLEKESATYGGKSIEDYAAKARATQSLWESMSRKQPGDPNKLAKALVSIAAQEQPPLRFIAGADAIAAVEAKVADLSNQINAYRELSSSLYFDNVS